MSSKVVLTILWTVVVFVAANHCSFQTHETGYLIDALLLGILAVFVWLAPIIIITLVSRAIKTLKRTSPVLL